MSALLVRASSSLPAGIDSPVGVDGVGWCADDAGLGLAGAESGSTMGSLRPCSKQHVFSLSVSTLA